LTTAQKFIYRFDEGNAGMRDLLGGKGANLCEMAGLGLPVPAGFVISTDACREYYQLDRRLPDGLMDAVRREMAVIENAVGRRFGDATMPMLVSVRSGSKFSMPGMMDTILNLGLNDQSVEALAKRSNNPRFAADSYRRLIQMFGNVVLEIPKTAFDEVFDAKKKQKKAKLDTDLDAKALKEVIEQYKKVVKKHTKHDFPQDPHEQLVLARDAVFRSWQNEHAKYVNTICPTAAPGEAGKPRSQLITVEEAILRVEPNQLYDFLVARLRCCLSSRVVISCNCQ